LQDLRDQKQRRTREELVAHLKAFEFTPRFSIGVWCFFPSGGRFHEPYRPSESVENALARVSRLRDSGIVDGTFGLEAHYPNEVNANLVDLYKGFQKSTGIRLIMISPNLFYDRRFEFGSLSNPDKQVRRIALERTEEALRLNAELETDFAVIWPGIDGYENPIGVDFYQMWDNFEQGLAEAMDAVPGIRVAIEPKPYEPRGNNIYRNTANGLLMTRNVEALLQNKSNQRLLAQGHALVTLNPEVGHVLMGHEELAYALSSILREGRLAHTHWNSQPLGNYDQDLNVGVLAIDQAYAGLLALKMYGYKGRLGLDINPERMPIETAIPLNINAIRAMTKRLNRLIDYDRLVEAMYEPEKNRGVTEDIVIRAFAPDSKGLIDLRK
jgi:xylose isomerase